MMKRMLMILALACVTGSVNGCCCCRDWFTPRTVASPVMAAPACPPAYDPCATPYGVPGATYAPAPGYVPQMGVVALRAQPPMIRNSPADQLY
jgi:hypothetical protein